MANAVGTVQLPGRQDGDDDGAITVVGWGLLAALEAQTVGWAVLQSFCAVHGAQVHPDGQPHRRCVADLPLFSVITSWGCLGCPTITDEHLASNPCLDAPQAGQAGLPEVPTALAQC